MTLYVTSEQQIASTDEPSVLTCPSNCSSWTYPVKVFGDVIYSNNSDRCWAAIHAGAISCDNGGRFLFTAVDGVTSRGHLAWSETALFPRRRPETTDSTEAPF